MCKCKDHTKNSKANANSQDGTSSVLPLAFSLLYGTPTVLAPNNVSTMLKMRMFSANEQAAQRTAMNPNIGTIHILTLHSLASFHYFYS